MRLNKKGFEPIVIILIVLALMLAGGAGYYVWNRNQDKATEKIVSDDSASVADSEGESACTAPEGYLVYDNTDVRFCFVYPEEWGTTSVALGVIDASNEVGNGWLGTFSTEANASFAFLADDWDYIGPGRGGPNNAVGFLTYEIYEPTPGDVTDYDIKISNADMQLYGTTSDFNIQGAIVIAMRRFIESEPYAGIEFQLNAPATGAFDIETAVVGDFVTEAQFDQMEVVLNSVTEY